MARTKAHQVNSRDQLFLCDVYGSWWRPFVDKHVKAGDVVVLNVPGCYYGVVTKVEEPMEPPKPSDLPDWARGKLVASTHAYTSSKGELQGHPTYWIG
jgi:hypothetical protein